MFMKIVRIGALTLTLVFGALLTLAAIMSDRLTQKEAVERVMSADEPCRAAFAEALDAAVKDPAGEGRTRSASALPLCRDASAQLEKISIFVPQDDYTDERGKRDMIKACAQLSKARADLLQGLAAETPVQEKLDAANRALARADADCQARFKRLAGG
jgi:hypothetical protein